MPKISVIIPVYNMEKYVGECLDSVLSQTLTDLEVIVVNDGSTDGSLKIIQSYSEKDNRIMVLNKKNEGVGAARNDGIKAATGDYLTFIDPDDKYATCNALLHCYETAEKEQVPVAGGRIVFWYEDNSMEEEIERNFAGIKINAKGLTEYKDYQYDYGYVCYIYKRNLIVDNQILFPLYSRFQDPPFFVKAMIAAERFYALEEPVYLYRQLHGSAKITASKTVDFLRGVMDNLTISKKSNLPQLHYITAVRLTTAGSYMAINNLDSDDVRKILFYMIKATAMVDAEWLKNEGFFEKDEFFLPELFDYMTSTSLKYERLRKNRVVRYAIGLFSRLSERK